MGRGLFEAFPHEVAFADAILGYSVEELCLADPRKQLGQTQFTQPALFVVNTLHYLKNVQDNGRPPDYAAGHSLGEYNALFAAGAFDFVTGLRLVQRRGQLMSQAGGGGMAAVIGLAADRIEAALQRGGFSDIDIANMNAPQQIVVSGPAASIHRALPVLEAAGAQQVIPLRVSAAFHSRYMREAKAAFGSFLNDFEFSPLDFPVISNVEAAPYGPDEVSRNLVEQITSPVRWTDSVRYLLSLPDPRFEEIGPGAVLTGMIRQIRQLG